MLRWRTWKKGQIDLLDNYFLYVHIMLLYTNLCQIYPAGRNDVQ